MRLSSFNVKEVIDVNGKRGTYLLFEVTVRTNSHCQLERSPYSFRFRSQNEDRNFW